VIEAQKLRYESQVIVDHVSPHGRQVTDVRGIVLQGALAQFKAAGHLDDYMRHYPAEHAATLTQALASSWVPVDVVVAHYDTLERMALSDAQISGAAEQLGASLFDQLFATIVRAIRTAGGGAGIWFGFKQTDRIWSRLYNGGACRILQVGPKDALYTISGLPNVNGRASRLSQCGFLRGVMSISTKACVIRVVPSRTSEHDTLTLSISWV
jgi:hypothetical protein